MMLRPGRVARAVMLLAKPRSLTPAVANCQAGAGRDVVDVLQHRPAFVVLSGRAVLDHVDGVGGVQVAGRVRCGQARRAN